MEDCGARFLPLPAEKNAELAGPPLLSPKPQLVNSKPLKAEAPPGRCNANRPETRELKHVRKRGRRKEPRSQCPASREQVWTGAS